MSRLEELRKQRGLITSHLAWLDAEIAAQRNQPTEAPGTSYTETPLPPPVPEKPQATAATALVSPANTAGTADILFDQFRTEGANDTQRARLGCALSFVGAFVLLGTVVFLIWFFRYRQSEPAYSPLPPTQQKRP